MTKPNDTTLARYHDALQRVLGTFGYSDTPLLRLLLSRWIDDIERMDVLSKAVGVECGITDDPPGFHANLPCRTSVRLNAEKVRAMPLDETCKMVTELRRAAGFRGLILRPRQVLSCADDPEAISALEYCIQAGHMADL